MNIVTRLDLSLFDDDDLENLSSLVSAERTKRIQARIASGEFPLPNAEENELAKTSKLDAIKAYRNRIGAAMSLTIARQIFDPSF